MRGQGYSLMGSRRENVGGHSGDLLTRSEGRRIDLSHLECEIGTLKGDFLRRVVEIVIGGILTVLEVRFMCVFIALSRVLWKGPISTNPVDPVKYQVDLPKLKFAFNSYETSMS